MCRASYLNWFNVTHRSETTDPNYECVLHLDRYPYVVGARWPDKTQTVGTNEWKNFSPDHLDSLHPVRAVVTTTATRIAAQSQYNVQFLAALSIN